ncbi:mCG140823, partial [Mus musculus]
SFLFSLESGRSLAVLGQPKVAGDRIGGDPNQNGGFVGTTGVSTRGLRGAERPQTWPELKPPLSEVKLAVLCRAHCFTEPWRCPASGSGYSS